MAKKFQLILTADYEVWGNGSGCVENCVVNPAYKMMRIAEKFGARITFFFDVCEYWAFEKIELEGRFSNNYRPASLMKKQLQEAILNGHDVQLHFHPQWLNYKFISNDTWNLDNRYWRLPEVDNYHNDDWSIEKLFKKGIKTLNTMFKSVDPNYEVVAFRAGGWCIQPEKKIINTMIDSGIRIDSTVAPGKINTFDPFNFNFSNVPELSYWKTGSSVTQNGNDNLIELPICTSNLNIRDRIYYKFKKLKYRNNFQPTNCSKGKGFDNDKMKLVSIIKSLREPWMLNFSDGTSFIEMRRITQKYMTKFSKEEAIMTPIVAISHPKTFGIEEEFEKYMSWVNENSEILSGTVSSWLQNFNSIDYE